MLRHLDPDAQARTRAREERRQRTHRLETHLKRPGLWVTHLPAGTHHHYLHPNRWRRPRR